MQVNVNTADTATNIPECMTIYELQHETALDNNLQQLKECIIKGWPENKDNIAQNLRPYCTFQDYTTVIDRVILKGRYIVIPDTLQKQSLVQLPNNHMVIEKTKILACKSIYGPGINSDIENYIKIAPHILNFSKCYQRNE